MKNRRGLLLTLTVGIVAMGLVVASVIADELLGVMTKVDAEGKKITVIEKDTEKEVVITINDDTVQISKKKGETVEAKVDLDKLDERLKKVQEKGLKGITLKVVHEKGVASKIFISRGKRAAPKKDD
jgi:hypothetical protein